MIGVSLTGVFNAGRVAIPSMIQNGQGGAIVLTSSTAGLIGIGSNSPGMLGYTARWGYRLDAVLGQLPGTPQHPG